MKVCAATVIMCSALLVGQAVADDGEDARVQSISKTITVLSECQKLATNETERAHWDKRLELAHKELAHAKRVVQLSEEEKDFAARRQTSAEEYLLVLLATVEVDMSKSQDRIEDRISDINRLKAERAELEVERAAARTAKEQDADANAERKSLIRNIDAELLARTIIDGSGLAHYQTARDDLSLEFFEVSDRVASLDWDIPTVQQYHRMMSQEMAREEAALVSSHEASPAAA